MLRTTSTLLLFCFLWGIRPALAQFEPAIERQLFEAANVERLKAGLTPYKWSDELMRAAREHAVKMEAANKLTHRAPGEADLMERIAVTKLSFNSAAENIAFASEAEDIHPGWMHSPGHRANILGPHSNALGVGVLKTKTGYFAVQDFARTTSSDPPAIAMARLEKAFNLARKEKRKLPAKFEEAASLNAAACEMADKDKASVKAISIPPGFHAAVGFTASEPEELPDPLMALTTDQRTKEFRIGACYRATPQMPGGVYWFVIVY